MNLTFTGNFGISYQRQRSPDLVNWTDDDAPVVPGESTIVVTVPAPVEARQFWRFKVNY